MTPSPHPAAPPCTGPSQGMLSAHTWTQRLAAGGFGARSSRWRDRHELIILNVPGGRSSLTITGDGHAHWYYEPRASPPSAAVLAAVIVHILGAPHGADATPGAAAYRAFPLKGAVGRYLQDRGLTVALRISEDLESFEATTAIEVTSPARPWLGAVQLTDDGHLDWECDYRAAFHGHPSQIADVITPILRASTGAPLRGTFD